jgi:hypothetical protein
MDEYPYFEGGDGRRISALDLTSARIAKDREYNFLALHSTNLSTKATLPRPIPNN